MKQRRHGLNAAIASDPYNGLLHGGIKVEGRGEQAAPGTLPYSTEHGDSYRHPAEVATGLEVERWRPPSELSP
jgi:hypothetical protein